MQNAQTSTSLAITGLFADSTPTSDPLPGAAGVVHDLGNLIQIATSALNIIARHPRVEGGALKPVVARAKTSLERAGALVRQTMDRASRDGMGAPMLIETVCVRTCLDEIAALLACLCEPDVTLTIDTAADLPLVRCGRLDLQNVILNLVLNARDAMPDGGAIVITAGAAAHAGPRTGLELHVADTGVGMSRETLERAFEPFFTTKASGRGGVGLAMVKRFIQEAGGSVKIASTLGSGSTVTIWLPPQADPAGLPPLRSPPPHL
jgi:signal transduction histidine kinase